MLHKRFNWAQKSRSFARTAFVDGAWQEKAAFDQSPLWKLSLDTAAEIANHFRAKFAFLMCFLSRFRAFGFRLFLFVQRCLL